MVKMMITVVIIYALCWLPLHTVTLVGDTHDEIWTFRYIQVVWIGCHWLAMSNCCYNPMVYCWMNSKFRNGFRYVLRFCPCVNFDKDDDHDPHKVKRVNTYISTVRNSDKRNNCIYTRSPSPRTISEETSIFTSQESIPLNKVNNGVVTAFVKPMVRQSNNRASDQVASRPDHLAIISGEKLPLTEDMGD